MSAASRLGRAFALVGAALLAACSSGPDKPKPKPLEPIVNPIAGRQVWSQRVGEIGFPLAVSTAGGRFTVASGDGTVVALQADNGKEIWRGKVDAKLAAGVGSDGRYAAVATRDNDIVVLEAGKPLWRKPAGTKVTTAPLVAGERVFVLGVDRSVQAFDAADGRPLWTVRRPGDPLTLTQPGVIAAYRDTLLVGQGPRLLGLDPRNGNVRFDVAVASPRGTNEVERLADLVAPALRVGDMVCARSFQSAVGCVHADRGTLAWSRNVGGTDGIGGDGELTIAADASDRISAWRTASGEVAWTADGLLYRDLRAPLVAGSIVVFGDGEGQLHFLARDTGRPLLRLATDGSGVVGAPVLIGQTMLVVTRNGGLFAFRPE